MDIELLKELRNYFGENDKTPQEHRLFTILDNLIKSNNMNTKKSPTKVSMLKSTVKISEPILDPVTPIQSLINDIGYLSMETQEILLKIGKSVHNLRHLQKKDDETKIKQPFQFEGGAMRDLEEKKFIVAHNLSIAQGILAHLNQII